MEYFAHNSWRMTDREPFGAVICGTRVRLTVHTNIASERGTVFVHLWCEKKGEKVLPMRSENGVDYTVNLTVPDIPCVVYYRFYLRAVDGRVLHCCAAGGEGKCTSTEGNSWRITVYDARFDTPKWFREGIMYQIFPDRFSRSSWEDLYTRSMEHINKDRDLRIHDDWTEQPDYRPYPGEKDYQPIDYFGGDLEGIRRKLPYLKSLGVTCLYLNPIFEAASNHRYNTGDYEKVDPILGTAEDLRALCEDARANGMRVMLDGVFSHTGSDSRYFNREGRYQGKGAYQGPDSPYYEWYRFDRFPDKYECWWGFKSLPDVKEMNPSYLEYIAGEKGILSHWRDYGVTSWRLDVADELPDAFIRALRARVKANDPEGVLLGEVWEECSAKRGPEGRRGYVNGDELDSAMDYPFANAVLDYCGEKTGAAALNSTLLCLREWYPAPFWLAQMNLLSSHDAVRAITRLSGAPDRNALPREKQALYKPGDRALKEGKKRFLLATAIQMFYPGVPCIYYGDEVGVTGMADPFNRAPYPWGHEDRALLERVLELTRLRQKLKTLRTGKCRTAALFREAFVLVRHTNREAAVLVVNPGKTPALVRLDEARFKDGPDGTTPIPREGQWTDEKGNATGCPFEEELNVPAVGCVIRLLKKRNEGCILQEQKE